MRNNLINYLPPFMAKYKEMQQIMSTEDVQMNIVDANIQRALNNAFILDCDEYGIRKYELLLSITPNSTETLESRKSRVSLKWNDMIPYTYKILVERLNGLCGVNNYTLEPDLENYYIKFIVHLSLFSEIKTLEEIIEDMLPMNIVYEIENTILCNIQSEGYIASVTERIEIIEIGG